MKYYVHFLNIHLRVETETLTKVKKGNTRIRQNYTTLIPHHSPNKKLSWTFLHYNPKFTVCNVNENVIGSSIHCIKISPRTSLSHSYLSIRLLIQGLNKTL